MKRMQYHKIIVNPLFMTFKSWLIVLFGFVNDAYVNKIYNYKVVKPVQLIVGALVFN